MNIVKYESLPEDILGKLANANVFFSLEYSEYIKATNAEYYLIYDENNILSVSVKTLKKVFRYANLLSEPYCYTENVQSEQEIQSFLDETLKVLNKRLHVDWVSITFAGSLHKAYPKDSERIRWGNYVINLENKTLEDVFAGFDSKHRNMVKRGAKSDIVVKFGKHELLEDYLKIDRQTWDRSDRKFDNLELYTKYLDNLGDKAIIGIAYKDSEPQGGLFGFFNDSMFYYMFGASANRPEPGSTHYLQYRTIEMMINKGVKAYNFVGCRIDVDKDSKYARIQHFKKGFGGELIECFLFRAKLNLFKCFLYKFILLLKNGKIGKDAIDDEKHKWKEIN